MELPALCALDGPQRLGIVDPPGPIRSDVEALITSFRYSLRSSVDLYLSTLIVLSLPLVVANLDEPLSIPVIFLSVLYFEDENNP